MKYAIGFLMMFIALSTIANDSPFACNVNAFTAQERKRHFEELGPALRNARTGIRELPNGYAFRFPADPKTFALLSEWIEQERRCCPFFDIALRVDREGGPLWLELTGRPGTKQFVTADFGPWMR